MEDSDFTNFTFTSFHRDTGLPAPLDRYVAVSSLAPQPPAKKKRGRPRKYGRPASPSPSSAPPVLIRPPPRSTGLPQRAVSSAGSPGRSFCPHVLSIEIGEDVSEKVRKFMCTIHPRKSFILAASGMVRDVVLYHLTGQTMSPTTYKGSFEIVSLSGFTVESGTEPPQQVRLALCASCDMSRRAIGGKVDGPLVAARRVQVILGSFSITEKKDGHTSPKGRESSRGELSQTETLRSTNSNEQLPASNRFDDHQFLRILARQSHPLSTVVDPPSETPSRYSSFLPTEGQFSIPYNQGANRYGGFYYRGDFEDHHDRD